MTAHKKVLAAAVASLLAGGSAFTMADDSAMPDYQLNNPW